MDLCRHYDLHPLSGIPQRGDEVFDVVNEDDEVVRQEQRGVVHQRNLLHRAIHAFIFNKGGEVFLQKRSRLKDVHPGTWDSSVAGHLNAGEDYEACAVRELEEEAGQKGAELKLVATLPPTVETGWEFVHLFELRQTNTIRFPCSEVDAGLWLSPDEVNRWIARRPQDFASGFLECWKVWSAVP